MNPYQIVKDFEAALCEYSGSKYAVTTNSCTMALLLACAWHKYNFKILEGLSANYIEIPKWTYVGVPMAIIHAGFDIEFSDLEWYGEYWLNRLPVIDSARRFTSDMHYAETFRCVSFHASKILGDTQGGAILHDNPEADAWLRKARFDDRSEGVAPKEDTFDVLGYHCYMSSDVAARLLLKLYSLPKHNDDLPNDDYPDLSLQPLFQ